ncbi:MAG: response regulator, partial [Lachnospiraceae bacterium]|nr:response regulator [Lachnospiraceae bacterium]
ASASKTLFLSNMSHDIRTPMNAIIGFTGLALGNLDDKVRLKDYLEKIKTSGEHLLKLINDVLDMSRIESGKVVLDEQPVNLREIFKDAETMIAGQINEKRQKLYVDVTDLKNEVVYADKLRFMQVLINLLSNANKFTGQDGIIKLTLRQLGLPENGEAIYEIVVSDNGIGMSEEFVERLFDPFERERSSTISHTQGTGLGMSITKAIVEIAGGEIAVNTKKGCGTTYVINAPFRIAEKIEEAKFEGEIDKDRFKGKKILLVEDNDFNREIATELLEEKGIKVYEACDGVEAVEMMKDAKPGDYDAILMDVQMPNMNGYEATKAIRLMKDKEIAGIPIIAMTANAFEEDKANAISAGMSEHLSKPVNVDKLFRILERFI